MTTDHVGVQPQGPAVRKREMDSLSIKLSLGLHGRCQLEPHPGGSWGTDMRAQQPYSILTLSAPL